MHLSPAIALAVLLAACGGSSDPPGFSREIAADGREIVSYAAGLPAGEDTLVPRFTIGKYVDDSSRIFGDLRDVDADTAGRIYALDFKAREIWVFDRDGKRLNRLSGPGEGPGEISRANGVRFGPDGTLWVNDHAKRMVLAIDPDGTERERLMSLIPGYGYRWAVVIDTAGVLWEPWSRKLSGPGSDPTATGVVEGTSRRMFRNLDPATGHRDSVDLDVTSWRSYRAAYPGGQMVTGIPFTVRSMAAMDTHRRVWLVSPEGYEFTRVNLAGDTTLELRIVEAGLAVTEQDIEEWQEGWSDVENLPPTLFDDLMPLIPETRPLVQTAFTDDRDRLWVGRTVPVGELAGWDVFAADGSFVVTIRGPAGSVPVVRGDRIYLMVEGDAGERYIVVAELPAVLRGSQ